MSLDGDTPDFADTALRLFADADTVGQLRRRRDARDLAGAARGCWPALVELGFAGMLVPEAFGGIGLDAHASLPIAEAMGKTLATAPFLSTAVMAATALAGSDTADLKARLLPQLAEGRIFALAAEETARHAPLAIAATARRDGGMYRITGRKVAVIDGNVAETLLVVARDAETPARLVMLAVDASAPGLTIRSGLGIDSLPAVAIALDDVQADAAGLVAQDAAALLERVFDAGRLHLAAEMLGAAQEAFDRTLDYLKTRVQFGRKIGAFQALQHRAAILFGELEIARSVLLKAGAAGTPLLVSLAKARIGDIANHVAAEAVQLHGGIGVTDDFDLGFFVKRIRAASESLGDSAFHAERYALLKGL
jgi:acyl-CoA dehydrogenase